MRINELPLVCDIVFAVTGIIMVISLVVLCLIMIPVLYFTVGQKYDAILGKKENIEFLAFGGMCSYTLGRAFYYAILLSRNGRWNMKLTHKIFGDFDFMQYATPSDISVSKIFCGIYIIVIAGFIICTLLMAPEIFADFKVWLQTTF